MGPGLLFWHCVHDQWTRFDRLSPDKFLIFQLLYQVQQKWRLQISSWNIANISESVSIKVALFSLSMFCYSLHSSTRQNIQSHCFYSPVFRPSWNYCFNTPQNKISISVNPWVFCYPSNTDSSNCCPFLGQHSLRVFRSLRSLTG